MSQSKTDETKQNWCGTERLNVCQNTFNIKQNVLHLNKIATFDILKGQLKRCLIIKQAFNLVNKSK